MSYIILSEKDFVSLVSAKYSDFEKFSLVLDNEHNIFLVGSKKDCDLSKSFSNFKSIRDLIDKKESLSVSQQPKEFKKGAKSASTHNIMVCEKITSFIPPNTIIKRDAVIKLIMEKGDYAEVTAAKYFRILVAEGILTDLDHDPKSSPCSSPTATVSWRV